MWDFWLPNKMIRKQPTATINSSMATPMSSRRSLFQAAGTMTARGDSTHRQMPMVSPMVQVPDSSACRPWMNSMVSGVSRKESFRNWKSSSWRLAVMNRATAAATKMNSGTSPMMAALSFLGKKPATKMMGTGLTMHSTTPMALRKSVWRAASR